MKHIVVFFHYSAGDIRGQTWRLEGQKFRWPRHKWLKVDVQSILASHPSGSEEFGKALYEQVTRMSTFVTPNRLRKELNESMGATHDGKVYTPQTKFDYHHVGIVNDREGNPSCDLHIFFNVGNTSLETLVIDGQRYRHNSSIGSGYGNGKKRGTFDCPVSDALHAFRLKMLANK